MARKPRTFESIDADMAKQRTRLKRAIGAIYRLERERKNLARAARPRGHIDLADPIGTIGPAIRESIADQKVTGAPPVTMIAVAAPADEGIPDFLDRRKAADAKDAEAKAKIEADNAERKKAKALGRIATMKAKKSGDTKRMPLSGRAALDMIKNG